MSHLFKVRIIFKKKHKETEIKLREMKKFLMVAIMFIMINMIAQNYCTAQTKSKPENCTYFQIVGPTKPIEWVFVGLDKSGKNKWLELNNSEGVTEYIEIERDEWSIYLKAVKGNSTVQIDLYQMNLITDGKKIKIVNVKDNYDYSKLVEPYNKTVGQKSTGNLIKNGNVHGYLIANVEEVNKSYNAGYSMYAAAWPLVKEYPGRSFQSGLFGTWMFPANKEPLPVKEEDFYTDIEGGLGWWTGTEYPTETPKFIMGGVQLNFDGWANGPGAGKGRDWNENKGKYGVAQLSPWLLFPPDGLNLKQGTCGEWFGNGYLPLPLTESISNTEGKNISTGNQCWTLFLNTVNFKGPVAFFTPYFWSEASIKNPLLKGLFLDTRPSNANKEFQMETQHIHSFEATDSKGQRYSRMAITQYPVGADGNSELLQRLMVYNKRALWDKVSAWFKGGNPTDGRIGIDKSNAYMQKFARGIEPTWEFQGDHIPEKKRALMDISSFMNTDVTDSVTLKIHWEGDFVKRRKTINGDVITLPQYYKLVKSGTNDIGTWIAVASGDVPAETGLHEKSFNRANDEYERESLTYLTPNEEKSSWKTPGPAAGPFKVKIGDGSTLTYYWYRFADQPALLNANLSNNEREEMQRRVELLHRNWTKDREYLPPPITGKLAYLDEALIVTPPKGLEVGFVPIVTKQGLEK